MYTGSTTTKLNSHMQQEVVMLVNRVGHSINGEQRIRIVTFFENKLYFQKLENLQN